MSSDSTTARRADDQRRNVDDMTETGTQSAAIPLGAVPTRQGETSKPNPSFTIGQCHLYGYGPLVYNTVIACESWRVRYNYYCRIPVCDERPRRALILSRRHWLLMQRPHAPLITTGHGDLPCVPRRDHSHILRDRTNALYTCTAALCPSVRLSVTYVGLSWWCIYTQREAKLSLG